MAREGNTREWFHYALQATKGQATKMASKNKQNPTLSTLVKAGLARDEAEIYLDLLEHGAESASDIAKHTSVKRTYVYHLTEDLISKGLITKRKEGRTTVFEPNSPDHLLGIVEEKKAELTSAERELEAVMSSLKDKYKSVDQRPIIQVFEGESGLKKIYKDILETNDDILLYRSLYDDKHPDLDEIVMNQVQRQVKHGIHVRTITPLEKATRETYLKHDEERLVKRHIIKSNNFELPAQIIVYKEKVAIISLKNAYISTLIDNKEISDTFRQIFEFIWERTHDEHEEIVKNWGKN